MLVLARKLHERIFVGDNIIIEVTDIQGGKVRLGITAPREVKVIREELRDDDTPVYRPQTG